VIVDVEKCVVIGVKEHLDLFFKDWLNVFHFLVLKKKQTKPFPNQA
jgi:hypothetical protein